MAHKAQSGVSLKLDDVDSGSQSSAGVIVILKKINNGTGYSARGEQDTTSQAESDKEKQILCHCA